MKARSEENITQGGAQNKIPLRYADFIRPNPHLRDWMIPYLPKNVFGRDLIISLVGTLIGFAIAVLPLFYLGNIGVVFGLAVLALTLWLFTAEVQGRYAGASVKFWMERLKK